MPEDSPTKTSDDRTERGLSPFGTELVDELAADGYRARAWKHFFARAYERSRSNLSESPYRVRTFLLWAIGGAIIGVGLLVLRWWHPQMPVPHFGHSIAWAAWYVLTSVWGVMHIGLADAGGPDSHRLGVPNGLSFVRLGLAPLIVAIAPDGPVTSADPIPPILVASLVIPDILDGQLARALGEVSRLGRMLDPLADVVSLTALSIALYRIDLLPMALLGLIMFRFPGGFLIALTLYLAKGPFKIRPTLLGRISVVLLYGWVLLTFITHCKLSPWPPAEWVAWAGMALGVPLIANIIYMTVVGLKHLRS